MPEDDPAQVQAKAQAYTEYQQTKEYIQNRLEYDLWTAAFFWPIPKGNAEHMLAPTQQELIMLRSGGAGRQAGGKGAQDGGAPELLPLGTGLPTSIYWEIWL